MVTVFAVCAHAFRMLIRTKTRGRPIARTCAIACAHGTFRACKTNVRRKRCSNGLYITVADLKTVNRVVGVDVSVFNAEPCFRVKYARNALRVLRYATRRDPKILDCSSGGHYGGNFFGKNSSTEKKSRILPTVARSLSAYFLFWFAEGPKAGRHRFSTPRTFPLFTSRCNRRPLSLTARPTRTHCYRPPVLFPSTALSITLKRSLLWRSTQRINCTPFVFIVFRKLLFSPSLRKNSDSLCGTSSSFQASARDTMSRTQRVFFFPVYQ